MSARAANGTLNRIATLSGVQEGERQQATVLFSDLSGYTATNERLDPETVRAIVLRIKVGAGRIVERHGGIVNQFVGVR